jgi:hypothetical protein
MGTSKMAIWSMWFPGAQLPQCFCRSKHSESGNFSKCPYGLFAEIKQYVWPLYLEIRLFSALQDLMIYLAELAKY